MRIVAPLLIIAGSILVALGSPVSSASDVFQKEAPVGKILEVRGNAYLQRDKNSTLVKLRVKRDVNHLLYAGERLWCDKGALLLIELNGKPLKVKPLMWFPIPRLPSGMPKVATPAGRSAKSNEGTSLSPVSGSRNTTEGKSGKKTAKKYP